MNLDNLKNSIKDYYNDTYRVEREKAERDALSERMMEAVRKQQAIKAATSNNSGGLYGTGGGLDQWQNPWAPKTIPAMPGNDGSYGFPKESSQEVSLLILELSNANTKVRALEAEVARLKKELAERPIELKELDI